VEAILEAMSTINDVSVVMKSLEQRTVPSLVNHGKEWIVEFLDTPGDIPMMLVQRKAMCTLPYWLVLAR
jgi:hypothetical protein